MDANTHAQHVQAREAEAQAVKALATDDLRAYIHNECKKMRMTPEEERMLWNFPPISSPLKRGIRITPGTYSFALEFLSRANLGLGRSKIALKITVGGRQHRLALASVNRRINPPRVSNRK